ncbi:hypothetical protein [Lactococcus formosensis]|uniref:Restriction endonuclease subunit S n=1 Tax=Lactococcus formosensis TaxID=1281486 RepID=A0A9X4PAY5_9LACT|nr:hypothetical protein [Lactococcus formosensis]MDG6194547.1 hypothetical protein [Lactococcus formosensis]
MAKIDDSVKKKVPELRFPGFTDDWEERKLGELANIVRGASPRPIQDPKWLLIFPIFWFCCEISYNFFINTSSNFG